MAVVVTADIIGSRRLLDRGDAQSALDAAIAQVERDLPVAVEGMRVVDLASRSIATFIGGSWEYGALTGPRQAAIAAPAGGGVVDAEARAALGAILSALRVHGLIAT